MHTELDGALAQRDAIGRKTGNRDRCRCLGQRLDRPPRSVKFHKDCQDTEAAGWRHLFELIEEAADDQREEFKPLVELSAEERRQVVTLPPTIARLTAVRHFVLYGSNVVRIPPEIGAMRSLEEFTPYTSYRLHWLPYEVTRCPNLRRSTVSTRALYGNYKYRPPFPVLPSPTADGIGELDLASLDCGSGARRRSEAAAYAASRSTGLTSNRSGSRYASPQTCFRCWSTPAPARVSKRWHNRRRTTSRHPIAAGPQPSNPLPTTCSEPQSAVTRQANFHTLPLLLRVTCHLAAASGVQGTSG